MKRVFLLCICFLVLGLGIQGWAADIYVSPVGGGSGTSGDPTDLQTALDMARTNGTNDTIYLQTGTYDASAATGAMAFEYGPTSNDNMAVTLSGGWNSGYTMQSDDPSLTLLDGGNDSRVLEITSATGVTITFTLENLTVQNGKSTATGGAIYAYSGTTGAYGTINLTVNNCLIRNNDNDSNGGGWYSNCYFEINDSTFSGNEGSNGGAMIIYDYPGGDQSLAPKIDNTTFSSNSTDGNQGSAIYNAVSPVITDCVFDGNFGVGSPIFSTTNSSLTISDSVFKNGNIIYWGSAIQFWRAGGKVTNCLFYDNVAGNGGSGNAALTYYNGGSGTDTIDIINCTFEDNQGDITSPRSDAVHNRGATMNITNSIFWNNMGTAGLYNGYGGGGVLGSVNLSFCDLQGGVPSGCTDNGDNINANPNFAGATDHHLTSGSQCIDSGDNSATYLPSMDFEGDMRKIDGDRNGSAIVDMGVDEYDPSPVLDLKANGSDGPITIAEGDTLKIYLSIDTVDYTGENADWWLVMQTGGNWFYFDTTTWNWMSGQLPSLQDALFDIPSKRVPKTSGLTAGTYKFYFGIDTVMDGNVTFSKIFYDMVKVIITD